MTRNLKGSLLLASMLIVTWATAAEACCHRRRACQPAPCGSGYAYGSPTGYTNGGAGYSTTGGAYAGGGTAAYPGYPGYGTGYDFGRPGYNPGGLGGPMSGIGVRPGLGAGGFGPGR
jgi:hypothetical protein